MREELINGPMKSPLLLQETHLAIRRAEQAGRKHWTGRGGGGEGRLKGLGTADLQSLLTRTLLFKSAFIKEGHHDRKAGTGNQEKTTLSGGGLLW